MMRLSALSALSKFSPSLLSRAHAVLSASSHALGSITYLPIRIEFSWNFLCEVFPDLLCAPRAWISTNGQTFHGLMIVSYLVGLPF